MDNSLISIVIPVYKVEKELSSCLDSVLAQTYPYLEIILVDDGSPDKCGQICDDYALKDNRIMVIHKVNGGLSDARNAGLDIAKGKYVTFLDSDDIIHVKYMELMYQAVHNNDISICDISTFNDGEVPDTGLSSIKDYKLTYFSAEKLMKELLTFRYPIGVIATNKLYKRELWESLRFPIGKIHEDEFVIHQLLDLANNIAFLDVPLYFYRQRADSIMTSAGQTKAMLDKLEALGARKLFFQKKGMKKQVRELNNEILYRCLMSGVTKDNATWKSVKLRTIFFENDFAIRIKALLLLKKVNYKLYVILQRVRNKGRI